MATVVINGVEECQIDGTKLSNLQAAYPNCWLVRENDRVAIRIPEYTLEKNCKYTLCFPGKQVQYIVNLHVLTCFICWLWNILAPIQCKLSNMFVPLHYC